MFCTDFSVPNSNNLDKIVIYYLYTRNRNNTIDFFYYIRKFIKCNIRFQYSTLAQYESLPFKGVNGSYQMYVPKQ